jgi:toxin FitB
MDKTPNPAAIASWQIQTAKARFSEVFRLARTEGPQRITRQGKEGVVMISEEQYERLTVKSRRPKSLVQFFRDSPLVGVELDLERDPDTGREVDLWVDLWAELWAIAMSGFLLDTNCVSELIRPEPEPCVLDWIDAADEATLYLSVLTLGEIRKGVAGLAQGRRRTRLETWLEVDLRARFSGRIVPVDAGVADRWGRLAADAKRQGKALPVIDGLLAATALHLNLTVVSRNARDFVAAHVPVLNPWEAWNFSAALLGMLNSCASNVTVVNIDNGFGAGYAASLMNRL